MFQDSPDPVEGEIGRDSDESKEIVVTERKSGCVYSTGKGGYLPGNVHEKKSDLLGRQKNSDLFDYKKEGVESVLWRLALENGSEFVVH